MRKETRRKQKIRENETMRLMKTQTTEAENWVTSKVPGPRFAGRKCWLDFILFSSSDTCAAAMVQKICL